MDIKLSDWIKDVDEELKSNALPMVKKTLISIKEKTIKTVEKHGYAYDMMGYKIIKD